MMDIAHVKRRRERASRRIRTLAGAGRLKVLLPAAALALLEYGAAAPADSSRPRSTPASGSFAVVVPGRTDWATVWSSITPWPSLTLVLAPDAESAARIGADLDGRPGGSAAAVISWSPARIPVVDDSADAIVLGRDAPIPEAEALRVLRPGGALYDISRGRTVRKPRPGDLDVWPMFLHGPDNNAVSRDRRIGPPRHLQWQAQPHWTRNHHVLNSVSAVVADAERIVAVIDEAPAASVRIPSRWAVVARNAFNGLLLWKRSLDSWANWRHLFRSGPVQLPRLLAISGDRVFLPLESGGPVAALNAATGELLTEFEETRGAEEIVPDQDSLFVIVGRPTPAQLLAGPGWRRRKKQQTGQSYQRVLLCLEAASGNLRWRWEPQTAADIEPLTLGVKGQHVCFQIGDGVICLDRQTGRERRRTAKAGVGRGTPRLMTNSTLVLTEDVVLWANGRILRALRAADGRELWTAPVQAGFRSPTDVFVMDRQVCTGPRFDAVRDLLTGRVIRKTAPALRLLQTAGHHHRCYREKAAGRFIICGKRGVELLDMFGAEHSRNNWIRGTCQYGVLPCNGLLILPPHCCGCYMEAKLNGLLALRSKRTVPPETPMENRIVRGPAYRASLGPATPSKGWPTWRADNRRSAASPVRLAASLREAWTQRVGSDLTAPVAAGGRIFVADRAGRRVLAIRSSDGSTMWTFVASGALDGPPTCRGNRVVFGSADGNVYCLDADKGTLCWRFQAARAEQFLIANGRIESVWPVPSSALVHHDAVYAAAGRSSYLDGGIDLYALDLRTGSVLHHRREQSPPADGPNLLPGRNDPGPARPIVQNATDLRTELAPDRADAFSMTGGVTNDVLVADGESIFLRWKRYGPDLSPASTFRRHLFSTSTLPDPAEVHRSHYVYGSGDFRRLPVAYSWIVNRRQLNPRFGYEPVAVFGLLLAFNDKGVWGVRRRGGLEGYEAFFVPRGALPADPHMPDFRPVKRGEQRLDPLVRAAWRHPVDVRPRTLAVTAGDLVIAGMPALPPGTPSKEAIDAFEGRKHGMLLRLDPASGREKSRRRLPGAPVWNGIAVDEEGRIVFTLVDGRITCLAGNTPASSPKAN